MSMSATDIDMLAAVSQCTLQLARDTLLSECVNVDMVRRLPMLKEFSLSGSTALVTGGGRGIGRAIALTLAEAGADVAIAARTLSQVEQVADEIRALNRHSLALQADVTDPIRVDQMVTHVTNELGRIDILVNNAGISGTSSLASFSNDAWNRIIETNLSGPFYCCRAVASQMLERRSGRIINISSNYATMATADGAASVSYTHLRAHET